MSTLLFIDVLTMRDVASLSMVQLYKFTPFLLFLILVIAGNKLTLETRPKERGLSTRDELLKFHNSFYSANIMALTVLGRGKQAK